MNNKLQNLYCEDAGMLVAFTHKVQYFKGSFGKGKKVKLSLCLTKYHTIKTYCGVEVYLHAFLTLALDGSDW
jgi:hypothetical protein